MPHLRALGIDCDLAPFMDSELYERLARPGVPGRKAVGLLRAAARRWRMLPETGAYDVVFLHREAMVFGPEDEQKQFRVIAEFVRVLEE